MGMDRHKSPTEPDVSGASAELEESLMEGAFSDDGVDLTLIRWMLSLSPLKRLEAAQDMVDTLWTIREASAIP